MRLTFWYAEKGYELALGPAIAAGAEVHGDEVMLRPLSEYRAPPALGSGEGSMICGVVKREILWEHQLAGAPLLYLDKGYHRTRVGWYGQSLPGWWRLCWNAVHPTEYLMAKPRPADRWERLGIALQPRRRGRHVVILGSSAKFHETSRLPHPTKWTQDLVEAVQHITPAPIIYRPKPSWSAAEPVDGTAFDHGGKTAVSDTLADAGLSITYGSIAAVDSIIAGVPCVVLGNAVARPISATTLAGVKTPIWESERRREQWAANLAYSHFTPEEIADGTAWKIIKEQLRHAI